MICQSMKDPMMAPALEKAILGVWVVKLGEATLLEIPVCLLIEIRTDNTAQDKLEVLFKKSQKNKKTTKLPKNSFKKCNLDKI